MSISNLRCFTQLGPNQLLLELLSVDNCYRSRTALTLINDYYVRAFGNIVQKLIYMQCSTILHDCTDAINYHSKEISKSGPSINPLWWSVYSVDSFYYQFELTLEHSAVVINLRYQGLFTKILHEYLKHLIVSKSFDIVITPQSGTVQKSTGIPNLPEKVEFVGMSLSLLIFSLAV